MIENKLAIGKKLITHYSLLITHYSLLITHYLLLITCLSIQPNLILEINLAPSAQSQQATRAFPWVFRRRGVARQIKCDQSLSK